MPLYTFQCSECKKIFEEFAKFWELRITSPCCNSIAFRRKFFGAPAIKVKGKNNKFQSPYDKRVKEIQKLKPEDRPLDGGIPFGEVPGDKDYKRKIGPKIGDKDYLGPLP